MEKEKINITDEMKQKMLNCEEVDIRFKVQDGMIKHFICLASVKGVEGFLAYMFNKFLENGTLEPDDICALCAESLAVAESRLESNDYSDEVVNVVGGMN